MNGNGLKEKVKRRTIASQITNYDILFLQETHSSEEDSKNWHKDFRAKRAYWDHGESNARGTGILISKELDIEEVWINEENHRGRIKTAVIKWKNQKLGLISVYAPNISWGRKAELEFIKFIETLEKVIEITSNKADIVIMGGDLNLVQSKWDLQEGKGQLHIKCIEAVQKCMGKFKLIDIYRELNPKKTITTFTQFGVSKEEKRRRLDYIYISENIKKATSVTLNKTITHTDHNLIMAELKYDDFRKRNNGIWRHNNLLNTDQNFIVGLIGFIRKMNYEAITGKQARWEFMKYKIGQYSREYSIKKAKEKRERDKNRMKELEEATDEFGNRKQNVSEEKFREIKMEAKIKLEEEEKAIIFRANMKYHEEGEKCTAYFFKQIKAQRKASNIDTLKKENGEILKGNEVGKEIYKFYETLYKNYDCKKEDYERVKEEFLTRNIERKISTDSSRELEKELTKEELRKALFNSMKEGKAPGNDGLTSGLYRAIWQEIETPFFEATKEAMKKGKLAPQQRQSIIRLIEKKGKAEKKLRTGGLSASLM